MADEVIFNNASGSDTGASGCGPVSPYAGTLARHGGVPGVSRWIGFFDAALLNLNLVAAGHLLFLPGATARKYYPVRATKAGAHVFRGSCSAGSAVISGVTSKSGGNLASLQTVPSGGSSAKFALAVNGAGAGGGAHYAWVSSVDPAAGTITLTASCITSGTFDVVIPPQVEADREVVLSGASSWAIGGKRRTLTHQDSDDIFLSDALPGWQITLENTGTPYECGLTLGVSGDDQATGGGIVLAGAAGTAPEVRSGGQNPVLKLGPNANRWRFRNLYFHKLGGSGDYPTIDLSNSAEYGAFFEECEISNESSGGSRCVGALSSGDTRFIRATFLGCHFRDCYAGAIYRMPNGAVQAYGVALLACAIERCGSAGNQAALRLQSLRGLHLWSCLFYGNVRILDLTANTKGADDCSFMVVTGCDFDGGNLGSARLLTMDHASHRAGLIFLNNILCRLKGLNQDLDAGYGNTQDIFLGYNGYPTSGSLWSNGSVPYPTGDMWDQGVDQVVNEPGFVSARDGEMNYELGSIYMVSKGYPLDPIGRGRDIHTIGSATVTHPDIGASQQPIRAPLIFWDRKVT